MGEHQDIDQSAEELRRELCVGHGKIRFWRRLMRITPSNPRCRLCNAPFSGIGGRLLGHIGFAPSRKNPLVCNS